MKGYVARDKDGSLWFHYVMPHRENNIEKTWWGSNDKAFEIFGQDFPEFDKLKWDDEPVKVELAINVVCNDYSDDSEENALVRFCLREIVAGDVMEVFNLSPTVSDRDSFYDALHLMLKKWDMAADVFAGDNEGLERERKEALKECQQTIHKFRWSLNSYDYITCMVNRQLSRWRSGKVTIADVMDNLGIAPQMENNLMEVLQEFDSEMKNLEVQTGISPDEHDRRRWHIYELARNAMGYK